MASTLLFHCGCSVSLLDRAVTLDVLVSSLGPSLPIRCWPGVLWKEHTGYRSVIIISFS